MVALRKPNGSVRALVVGDVFRRLVSKALARHYAAQLQEACLPFQFGLSSRAGTEALYRCLRTATEIDPHATILSLDARGAFDHVSRQAMLGALQANPALTPLHPYARMWYGTDSAYQWVDEHGTVHTITQSEGGEQGDPLMPARWPNTPRSSSSSPHREREKPFSLTSTICTFWLLRHASVHCTAHWRRDCGNMRASS